MSFDSDNQQPAAKRRPGIFSSLFCSHHWERYGSGYDSHVKCVHCETVREEKPGDVASW